MTTNQILTASFLDILFENRNKAYGAYEIRKAYPENLMKAVGLMLLMVVSLSIYVMSQPNKVIYKETVVVMDSVGFDRVKQIEKQVEKQLEKRTVKAQPPTKVDRPIVVIPDNQIQKTPPIDRTDTSEYVPGPTNSPATGDGRNIVQGTIDTVARFAKNHVEPVEPQEPPIIDFAEVQPEFPGGEQAWLNYLQRMLRVPDDLEPGDRKTVRVKFVVNANGEVTDAVITNSAGASFDREVLRVIGRMPKWKPGRQNGKNVAVYFTQPVTFATIEE